MIRQLNINNYETYLALGNDEHERRKWRPVVININLRFPDDFSACGDDNIEGTVCYYSLLDFIDKKLGNEEFRLIERVAEYVYEAVSEYVGCSNVLKRVEVIKPRPISDKNLGSSSFICSDW
ncbi:dihydroneopterin aldolase [Alphaproteobacteria bacterium]|nr:dihydroneopterin aldolase [Alphaproteobacteria bacterium]